MIVAPLPVWICLEISRVLLRPGKSSIPSYPCPAALATITVRVRLLNLGLLGIHAHRPDRIRHSCWLSAAISDGTGMWHTSRGHDIRISYCHGLFFVLDQYLSDVTPGSRLRTQLALNALLPALFPSTAAAAILLIVVLGGIRYGEVKIHAESGMTCDYNVKCGVKNQNGF